MPLVQVKTITFIINRVKKQITLFALLVFFLAQFGKVINYCFCTIAAYQQTSSLACDCEKQLFTDIKKETADRHQSPHTYAAHPPAEDLFHLPLFATWAFHQSMADSVWPPGSNESLFHTFGKPVFHPPLLAV